MPKMSKACAVLFKIERQKKSVTIKDLVVYNVDHKRTLTGKKTIIDKKNLVCDYYKTTWALQGVMLLTP